MPEIIAVELLGESPVDSEKNESESMLKQQALQYQALLLDDSRL